MPTQEEIKSIIKESLQVDEELRLKEVRRFNTEDIKRLGVNDLQTFLAGLLDAENNEEFNDSTEDYIKGYKYGKTGTF